MGMIESIERVQVSTVRPGTTAAKEGITVRVGKTSWVIGDEPTASGFELSVEQGETLRDAKTDETKAGVVFQPVRRPSLRDSFRMGLVFGLAMGCLGLILFHQMPAIAGASSANPTGAWPGSAAMTGPAVTTPAINAFALSVGKYPDQTSAQVAQAQLQKQGLDTVIYPAGQSQRQLIVQMAVQMSDLSAEQHLLEKRHLSARTVHLSSSVRSIPTLSSTSTRDGKQISKWLSAEVSAANSLMACLADGEPARDAQVATEKAVKLAPSSQSLGSTGYGSMLQALDHDIQNANQELEHYKNGQAELDLMSAYSVIATIQHQA